MILELQPIKVVWWICWIIWISAFQKDYVKSRNDTIYSMVLMQLQKLSIEIMTAKTMSYQVSGIRHAHAHTSILANHTSRDNM